MNMTQMLEELCSIIETQNRLIKAQAEALAQVGAVMECNKQKERD